MKKRKVVLAVGLSLAIGICGASLVACDGDDTGKTPGNTPGVPSVTLTEEKSDYYLAGDSTTSTLFASALGSWNAGAGTTDDVPDSIAFYKTTTANTYAMSADFFVGDQFKVVQVGQEWKFEVNASKLSPKSTETSDFYGADDGVGGGGNFCVRKDGNYTLVLTIKGDDVKVQYVRNGDPLPVKVHYNYWIKGETISGGAFKNSALTKFTTDNKQTDYTISVNLKENEKISILELPELEGNLSKTAAISNATLKEGAAITALEGDADYTYKAGAAGYYTITIKETDDLDADGKKYTTKRVVEVEKADTKQFDFKIRAAAGGVIGLLTKNEYDLTLNNDTGKYEYTFTVAEEAPDEPSGIEDMAVGDTIALSVVPKGGSALKKADRLYELEMVDGFLAGWDALSPNFDYSTMTVLAADTYTVSVDPNTFEVTITGENDVTPSYTVYAHGDFNGAGWKDHETSAVAKDGAYSATITLTLKEGDTFGFRTFYTADHTKTSNQISWGSAAVVAGTTPENTVIIAGKLGFVLNGDGNVDNFKAIGDCKITFTVTVDATGAITAISAAEAAA